LFGRQLVHPLLGSRPATTAHAGNLSDHALHARVIGRHPGYQAAAVTRSHDADPLGIDTRLARDKTDGGADVLSLVGEIHLPAHHANLDGDLALRVGFWQRRDGKEFPVAVAPTTVIEGQKDKPGLEEVWRQSRGRAAPRSSRARAENDRRPPVRLLY